MAIRNTYLRSVVVTDSPHLVTPKRAHGLRTDRYMA